MQRDPRAFLWDVRESAIAIQSFVAGMDASAYAANEMVQAAVERKFEIIGEALSQLAKLDPRTCFTHCRTAANRRLSQPVDPRLCDRETRHRVERDR